MSEFFVEFGIANDADEVAVRDGRRPDVRSGTGVGLVATSALRLHLPRVVVVYLGRRVERRVFQRRTSRGVEFLDRAWGARVTLSGRASMFTAVVEPFAEVATLGRMVLSELDLVAYPEHRRLTPRDPDTIITEV